MSGIPRQACAGCEDDFYNGRAAPDARCWSALRGEMVKRFKIHYLTAPTVRGAFTEVTVPSCYHQVNQHVFSESVPDFAVGVRKEKTSERS